MNSPSLLALRRAADAEGMVRLCIPFPVYLVKISRSGLRVHWSCHPDKAARLPRAKWEKLREKFPLQLRGRLVRLP